MVNFIHRVLLISLILKGTVNLECDLGRGGRGIVVDGFLVRDSLAFKKEVLGSEKL